MVETKDNKENLKCTRSGRKTMESLSPEERKKESMVKIICGKDTWLKYQNYSVYHESRHFDYTFM